MPESFRWHVAHDRFDVAEEIVRHVAKVNKKTLHSTEHILRKPHTTEKTKKHTIFDMFSSRKLILVTVLSAMNWYATFIYNIFLLIFFF